MCRHFQDHDRVEQDLFSDEESIKKEEKKKIAIMYVKNLYQIVIGITSQLSC